MRNVLFFAALALAACKTAEPVPEALSDKYTPTGEIQFQGVGSTFDASRVVGPQVNMTLRTDGSWGGRLRDQPQDITVYSGRAVGVNFTLSWEANSEGTVVTGQVPSGMFRFETTGEHITIRSPKRSFDFNRYNADSFGPMGACVVKGEAGLKNPPMPQWGLAMLGAF